MGGGRNGAGPAAQANVEGTHDRDQHDMIAVHEYREMCVLHVLHALNSSASRRCSSCHAPFFDLMGLSIVYGRMVGEASSGLLYIR